MIAGKPLKQITMFSIPIIVGNIFQQFYQVIDTLIVGRYVGVDALAALGVTVPIGFALIGFAIGLSTGFTVIVSQRFGANDEVGVRKSIAMAILATFICSIFLTIISYFATRVLLVLISTPENILNLAESYFKIIVYGIISIMYYNTFSSILRAIGDSKTPLFFLIFSSILNVVGDYICVAIFNWGVQGAAIATVMAQSISALLSLLYIIKKYPEIWPKGRDWEFDKNMFKRLFSIGIPSGFHVSVISIGVLIVQANLNNFGYEAVAGFGVGIRIESLFVQSFVGFGAGLTTYCGQNIGAMQIDRVKEGVKKTLLLTSLIAIINSIILYFFSYDIATLFIDKSNTQVIEYTVIYTQTVGKYFLALTLIFIYRSSCQGLGSGLIPMFCAFEEIVFRVIAIIFIVPKLGYLGLCLASPFAWVTTGITVFVFYKILLKKIDKSIVEQKALRIY